MKFRMTFFVVLLLLNSLNFASLQAGEISYFRRDSGVVTGNNPLPDEFQSREQIVWKQELLPGHSTPLRVREFDFPHHIRC